MLSERRDHPVRPRKASGAAAQGYCDAGQDVRAEHGLVIASPKSKVGKEIIRFVNRDEI